MFNFNVECHDISPRCDKLLSSEKKRKVKARSKEAGAADTGSKHQPQVSEILGDHQQTRLIFTLNAKYIMKDQC